MASESSGIFLSQLAKTGAQVTFTTTDINHPVYASLRHKKYLS